MIPNEYLTLALALMTGVFALIGWLLKDKDAKQEGVLTSHKEQIELLFTKHDVDAKDLQEMRVMLAQEHYRKPELDSKFDRLDKSITDGLNAISVKVDKLTEAVMAGKK